MALYPFKKSDVIRTHFVAYPSYQFTFVYSDALLDSNEKIYLFASGSPGTSRQYHDVNLAGRTTGYEVTGAVQYSGAGTAYTLSGSAGKTRLASLDRLRATYFSASFFKPDVYRNLPSGSLKNCAQVSVLNIPSALYGSSLVRSSVSLRATDGSHYFDDGFGLIQSSSGAHKGFVLYEHGVVVLTGSHSFETTNVGITASFSGTNLIPVNLYLCTLPRGQGNFSTNESFAILTASSNRREIRTERPTTYVTSIVLYDKDYKAIGVAKLSSPVRKDEDAAVTFRLKMAF